MAENTAYFDGITAARSQLLSEQEALEGQTLISLETCDMAQDDFFVYGLEHFGEWLTLLRNLSREQQELVLSYYCLSKTQLLLAKILSSTQTLCSFDIRMAVKVCGLHMMMGGPPTADQMRPILLRAGFEHKVKGASLAELIARYVECRSFETVAREFKIKNRPDIRRTMSQAVQYLLRGTGLQRYGGTSYEVKDETVASPEEIGLGSYLFCLIDRVSATGPGKSKRTRDKSARAVVFRDPPCVGEFRLKTEDPGFQAMFVSQANR